MKFKTTLKCSGCVAQVASALDEIVGKENWKVDVAQPVKILEIESSNRTVDVDKIEDAFQQKGFKLEPIV
ncbi:MAG: hypothetical protein MUE33_02255 [Cytophagaceae bacterium]|jgi:copper chaperone CopZ|nr:hypothetical protein [Cytophagaceae bacterium]